MSTPDRPAGDASRLRLEDLPLLERTGISYLRNMARSLPNPKDTDPVHLLDESELKKLRAIERGAVIRSGAAGATSALLSAAVVVWAEGAHPGGGWAYWVPVLSVSAVAAIVEVAYLYWDALKSTLKLTRAAGLPLFDEPDDTADMELAGSLARAALELPNPAEPTEGINPLREAPKLRLLIYGLLYKGKVAVTNFAMKFLIRRAFGRMVIRGAEEMIAIPVTAIWNASVTWLVMREARLRVVGPSAAQALVEELWATGAPQSPQRGGAIQAVASAVVRSHDMHPNVLAMLRQVKERVADSEEDGDIDDSQDFLSKLKAAPPDAQRFLIAVLTLAAISDGKLAGGEAELLREARRAAGLSEDIKYARKLAGRLRAGKVIRASDLLPAG
jgi:hypothetical protein